MKTYVEQLTEVQDAISAILANGQATDINGRRLTRANLADLEAREKRLMPLAKREERGGTGSIRMFRGVPPG